MTGPKVHVSYRDQGGRIFDRNVDFREFEHLRESLLSGGYEILGAWDAALDEPPVTGKPVQRVAYKRTAQKKAAPAPPTAYPRSVAIEGIVMAVIGWGVLLGLLGLFIASLGNG